MLLNKLPSHIQPVKLCMQAPPEGTSLTGSILLSELINLDGELKAQKDTPVSVSLLFGMDKDGLCCISVDLAVDLTLICQRCLQPMTYPLRITSLVSPVASDTQAQQLPERYEPLLMTQGEISLAEWIAEELHLALPLAPRHEPSCNLK
jgi:uncharacterized protein